MTVLHSRPALAALVVLALAGSAAAQTKPPSRAAVLQGLLDCRSRTDNADRLACYDAAASAMDVAERKGDIVVVDREQAKTVRRQAFGFALPSMALFEKGETVEKIESVAGTVASAQQQPNGKWLIKLSDGASWAQTDAEPINRAPRSGMTVEIKSAAMGSYLMSVGGQRSVRARRVE